MSGAHPDKPPWWLGAEGCREAGDFAAAMQMCKALVRVGAAALLIGSSVSQNADVTGTDANGQTCDYIYSEPSVDDLVWPSRFVISVAANSF